MSVHTFELEYVYEVEYMLIFKVKFVALKIFYMKMEL